MFERIEALCAALDTVRLRILDVNAQTADSQTHEQKLRDRQVRRAWEAYRQAANAALQLVYGSAQWLPALAAAHRQTLPGEWTESLVQLVSLDTALVLPEWASAETLTRRAADIGERQFFLYRLGRYVAPLPDSVPAPTAFDPCYPIQVLDRMMRLSHTLTFAGSEGEALQALGYEWRRDESNGRDRWQHIADPWGVLFTEFFNNRENPNRFDNWLRTAQAGGYFATLRESQELRRAVQDATYAARDTFHAILNPHLDRHRRSDRVNTGCMNAPDTPPGSEGFAELSVRLQEAGNDAMRQLRERLQPTFDTLYHIVGLMGAAPVAIPAVMSPSLPPVPSDPLVAVASGATGEGGPPSELPKRKLTQGETNAMVADWFRRHPNESPADIKRDRIAAEIGASCGAVSKSPMWLAFADKKKAATTTAERTVSLSDEMLATVPGEADTPDELAELIEEQTAEESAEQRRHNRRHRRS